jgi:hypothetical protein
MALDNIFLDRCKANKPYNEALIPDNAYRDLLNKKEIREIFNQNYFRGYEGYLKSLNDVSTINAQIRVLKTKNSQGYDSLFADNNTFGPGERVLYYLIDGVKLAGTGTSGDINIDNTTYEMKSTKFMRGREWVGGFYTGRSIDTNKIQTSLASLAKSSVSNEIKASVINEMKADKNRSAEVEKIIREYADMIYESYFKKYKIIFFDSKQKEIIAIKQVVPKDIDIEVVTQNAIKPLIKIN